MDAALLLKRQGWKGDGHALSHTGNGLKKPLLVSKKVDVLGLGINKHTAVSDQWWMRAFDQGLKDLGTGKKGVLGNIREKGIVHGGLYGRFVRGEGVPGTFEAGKEVKSDGEKKRKRDHSEDTVEAKKARKAEKKAKRDNKDKASVTEKGQGGANESRKRKHSEKQAKKSDESNVNQDKASRKKTKTKRGTEGESEKATRTSGTEDAGTTGPTESVSVIDAQGNVRFTCTKHQPVPLDPTIWEGIDVKLLPKAVRKARREWMSQQREAQKPGKPASDLTRPKDVSEEEKQDVHGGPHEIDGKSRKDRTKKSKKS